MNTVPLALGSPRSMNGAPIATSREEKRMWGSKGGRGGPLTRVVYRVVYREFTNSLPSSCRQNI